jgi:hypothetical protein
MDDKRPGSTHPLEAAIDASSSLLAKSDREALEPPFRGDEGWHDRKFREELDELRIKDRKTQVWTRRIGGGLVVALTLIVTLLALESLQAGGWKPLAGATLAGSLAAGLLKVLLEPLR